MLRDNKKCALMSQLGQTRTKCVAAKKLLNHLVGEREQVVRNMNAECLCRL